MDESNSLVDVVNTFMSRVYKITRKAGKRKTVKKVPQKPLKRAVRDLVAIGFSEKRAELVLLNLWAFKLTRKGHFKVTDATVREELEPGYRCMHLQVLDQVGRYRTNEFRLGFVFRVVADKNRF